VQRQIVKKEAKEESKEQGEKTISIGNYRSLHQYSQST
jgi:hypothetical protein